MDIAVMAFAGPLVIGRFLLMLVVTGLEHHQAYAVLGHPGFTPGCRRLPAGENRGIPDASPGRSHAFNAPSASR
jgi:hypothetical protein